MGIVGATIEPDGLVTVENVPSHRDLAGVEVRLADRTVHADIAWGGNWFALVEDHGETLDRDGIPELTRLAAEIRRTLNERGDDRGIDAEGRAIGGPVDHVELFTASPSGCDARNFVLCPGGAYDRSPCGTGTSAKLACLAADGRLRPGEAWTQESIVGSRFVGRYRNDERPGRIVPSISGRAWITAEVELVIEEDDPCRHGT